MSSFCSATEADFDTCFSEIIRNERAVRCYLTFMVGFLIFVLCSDQLSPYNFLLWLALAICFLAAFLKVFPCQLRPRYEVLHQDEEHHVHVHLPPSITTREQLSDIRIQLALLERDFDDRDYDALRALDTDILPDSTPAMTEEEVNAIPSYIFGVQSGPGLANGINRSSEQHASTSPLAGNEIAGEDALVCGVCLEEAKEGELIRRLPCSHQG